MTHETASLEISAGLVRLTPPLPYISSRLGSGTVDAIGPDRLVIKPSKPITRTGADSHSDLQISVNPKRSVNLQTEFGQADGDCWLMLAHGPDSQRHLNELLNSLRKQQHIDLCNNQDVESSDRYTGFSDFSLRTCALPELNWNDIQTSQRFLGRTFSLPVLITGMTGGVEQGETINRRLAEAAAALNIPMGVGSQRIALENQAYDRIFRVKEYAPNLFLIGNMGMAQLGQPDFLDQCRRAVDMIRADAFAVHLNCLQELIQEEGDRRFAGVTERIGILVEKLGVPIVVKEVGVGIDADSVVKLANLGVAAIDVGGKGGTSWARIEGMRSADPRTSALGDQFRDWGIPTAHALDQAATAIRDRVPLIATGGIRDGITVAKAVGIGATMVGIGLPLMRAALQNENAAGDWLSDLQRALRIAMLCTASRDLASLKQRVNRSHKVPSNFGGEIIRD